MGGERDNGWVGLWSRLTRVHEVPCDYRDSCSLCVRKLWPNDVRLHSAKDDHIGMLRYSLFA